MNSEITVPYGYLQNLERVLDFAFIVLVQLCMYSNLLHFTRTLLKMV